jgi:hypothetical protein
MGDLNSENPDQRQRDKNTLLCFDLGVLVYYEGHSRQITIIPAELIEKAETARDGYRNITYSLHLWLKGREYPMTLSDSHQACGLVGRLRQMNPGIPKGKWWEH